VGPKSKKRNTAIAQHDCLFNLGGLRSHDKAAPVVPLFPIWVSLGTHRKGPPYCPLGFRWDHIEAFLLPFEVSLGPHRNSGLPIPNWGFAWTASQQWSPYCQLGFRWHHIEPFVGLCGPQTYEAKHPFCGVVCLVLSFAILSREASVLSGTVAEKFAEVSSASADQVKSLMLKD
jgi:hypothetical protein